MLDPGHAGLSLADGSPCAEAEYDGIEYSRVTGKTRRRVVIRLRGRRFRKYYNADDLLSLLYDQ
jgi:hypothetical protein